MKYAASFAALAATAAAQQFVLYSDGDSCDTVERSDPIVAPGNVSVHAHHFFGASSFEPEVSYESLQDADCSNVGAADGSGNAQDKSIYWHPALYADMSNGNGYMKIPVVGHKMYYRKAGDDGDKLRDPFEFPEGFRMVAGNVSLRAARDDGTTDVVSWNCYKESSDFYEDDQQESGGFPEGFSSGEITDCPGYPYLSGNIHFPHCWNGNDFDLSNPTAHMSYPEGHAEYGKCPSSHPTRVPHIFMENIFAINEVADKIDMSTLALSHGDDTGFGYHADFFNGWEEGALPELYDSCPQGDYGNHDIGTCPSYKTFSTKRGDCKIKTQHEEEVDKPGPYLPGCNPITEVNPAPKYAAVALGVSTNNCSEASSVSTSSTSDSDSESGSGNTDDVQSVSYQDLSHDSAESSSSAAAVAQAYTVQEVEYQTKIVVVTETSPEPSSNPPHAPHHHQHHPRHAFAHKHKRGF